MRRPREDRMHRPGEDRGDDDGFREFAEIDGALIEVRLNTAGWTGDGSGALTRLNERVHAAAGCVLRAHRQAQPEPSVAPEVWEEPIRVEVTETPWATVTRSVYAHGAVIESSQEFTISTGEVIRRSATVFESANGQNPRRRLDIPALKPCEQTAGYLLAGGPKPDPVVGKDVDPDWGMSRMPPGGQPPNPRALGAPDGELEDAMRWAAYGSGHLDPVERLQREREQQAREAERQAAHLEARKIDQERQEAAELALWSAKRAIASLQDMPGAAGLQPRTFEFTPSGKLPN